MTNGSTRDLGEIARRLDQTEARLSKLIGSFDRLESDLLLLDESDLELHMCIDFHDLYGYLKIDRGRLSYNAENHDRIVEDYVRILLLHETRRPVVLLPAYYAEFRAYISSKLFYSASSEIRAELSLSRVRRRLKEEVAAPDGLLVYLEKIVDGVATVSYERLSRLTQRLLSTIEDISPQLQGAQEAAFLVRKFDMLVDRGRLVGVSTALGGEHSLDFVADDMLGVSRRMLDELKPRATRANLTDAEALSALVQLNRYSLPASKAFYLISNADTIAKVVERLNSRMLESEERIQLRDLSFWALWFGFSLRVRPREGSTLGRYTEFRRELRPLLTRLREQNLSLQDVIQEHKEEVQGELASEDVETRLLDFDVDLELALRQIAQPLLDPRWKLEVLTDTLGIVSGEGAIDSALSVISGLLKKIDSRAMSLNEAKDQLERLTKDLDTLISDLEERVSRSLTSLSSGRSSFAAGILDFCQLRSPYRNLLLLLELEGSERVATQVLGEIEKLRAIESEAIEALALDIMATIYLGQHEDVEGKLLDFERRFPDDWSTIYLRALWEEEQHMLDSALSHYEVLTGVLSTSRIYFHISRVYWAKYSQTQDLECLQKAEESALRALPGYQDASYGIKVALVLLISDVRKSEYVMLLKKDLTEVDFRSMVERLKRQASGRKISSETTKRLGEISASL